MKKKKGSQQSSNIQQGNGAIHSPVSPHVERDAQNWKDVAEPFGAHIASRSQIIAARLRQRIPLILINRQLLRPQVWRPDYPGLNVSKWAGRIVSPIQSLVDNIQRKIERTPLLDRQGDELQWFHQHKTRRVHKPGLSQNKFHYYTGGSVSSEAIPVEHEDYHTGADILPQQAGELAETYSQPEEYAIPENIGQINEPFHEVAPSTIIETRKLAGDIVRRGVISGFAQAEPLLSTYDISLAKEYPYYQLHKVSYAAEEFKQHNIKEEIESQSPQVDTYQDKSPVFIPGKQGYRPSHSSLSANAIRAKKIVGEIGRRVGISRLYQPQPDTVIKGQIFKDKSPSQEDVMSGTLSLTQEKPGVMVGQHHLQPEMFHRELEPAETKEETLSNVIQSGISDLSKEYNGPGTSTEPRLIEPPAKLSKTNMASGGTGGLVGKTKLDSRISTPSVPGGRVGVDRMSLVSPVRLPHAQKETTEYLRRMLILPTSISSPVSDSQVPGIARQHMIKRDAGRLSTEAIKPLPLTLRSSMAGYRSPSSAGSGLFSYGPSVDRPGQSLYCSPFKGTWAFEKPFKAAPETITVTDGIPKSRQVRSISTDQPSGKRSIGDFGHTEADHVYTPGLPSLIGEKTPTMYTLIHGTGSPMVQLAHPKLKAGDVRLHPDAFEGTVFLKTPIDYDSKTALLGRRMDESIMNIMPQSEAAETQSTEQSQKADIDIDSFAQKVYRILKRQLAVEKERRGVYP